MMTVRSLSLAVLAILSITWQVHAARPCESLKSLTLENATITLAQSVAAGAFSVPASAQEVAQQNAVFKQLPAFCRVAATLRPSTDSDIQIEVWMPLSNWNNKFQAVGNGGWAGSITYSSGSGRIERGMAEALKRGYATASTDTGHVGDRASFALGHPEKLIDFGYRAVHEMTVKAKTIIAAFYGSNPRYSYWNGCSTGGRQALMEAQRFPSDYDGIIAGAPANPLTRAQSWGVYVGSAGLKDPASFIPRAKYQMIHRAVVNACDALDGLKDSLIGDPTRCVFDFKFLECKAQDSSSCLVAGQAEAVEKMTGPMVHPKTGEMLFPGFPLGSELNWASRVGGPDPSVLNTDFFKYVVFKDPNWNWRTFDLETDSALADEIGGGTLNATPDLNAFKEDGGKLLMYHGWSDERFSPVNTISYYESVIAKSSSRSSTDEWLRLFLAPGMAHCGGGEGPNLFDVVSALEQWVEYGKAPNQIVASFSTGGKVDRTRPLCPYPKVAKYKGDGSINDAANFVCGAP